MHQGWAIRLVIRAIGVVILFAAFSLWPFELVTSFILGALAIILIIVS